MKKFIISISLFLLFSCCTYSQEDSVYFFHLKTMMEKAGTEAIYKAAIKQMVINFKSQKTDVPSEFWDSLQAELLKSSVNVLIMKLSPVYKKYFNTDDLKEIISFYSTPIGKKLAEKSPFITQEAMEIGKQWGMEMGQKIMEKLKEKGFK